ncbi:MAG: hypothetical protein ACKUBY_05650 [Candidatus Moraniibacteriota bacterium]|jgi:hypothetical protein
MRNIYKIGVTITLLILSWVLIDAFMFNDRTKTRIDKVAGGSLIRSMSLSDNQVFAHTLLEQHAENKNLSCLGTTPELRETNLARMLTIINNGGVLSNETDAKCLEMVFKGPSSFKDIVSEWFAEEPEPKLIKSVRYNPSKIGVGGMITPIPGTGSYTYKCTGSYRQQWYTGTTEFIGCSGIYAKNMPAHAIRSMIKQDPREYGEVLITANNNFVSINLNIPQTYEEYKDIVGYITVDFYR